MFTVEGFLSYLAFKEHLNVLLCNVIKYVCIFMCKIYVYAFHKYICEYTLQLCHIYLVVCVKITEENVVDLLKSMPTAALWRFDIGALFGNNQICLLKFICIVYCNVRIGIKKLRSIEILAKPHSLYVWFPKHLTAKCKFFHKTMGKLHWNPWN